MLKNLKTSVTAVAFLGGFLSNYGFAQVYGNETGYYLTGTVGLNELLNNITFPPGYTASDIGGVNFGLELGDQINSYWAMGLAGNYIKNNTSTLLYDFNLKTDALLVNNYFYLPLPRVSISPYLGLGVGWGRVRSKITDTTGFFPDTNSNVSSNVLILQPLLGVKYAINDNLDIRFEYRYLDTSYAKIDNTTKQDIHMNLFDLGMRYLFA